MHQSENIKVKLRLIPSALRSGVVPELWGPYTVLSASKNFFMSFLSAKDWISSAFFFSARGLACLWASSEPSCICLNRQSCWILSWYFWGKPCVFGVSLQGVPAFLCHCHQTNLGVCEILVLGNPFLKSERCLWRLSSSHLHLLNCVPVHLNGCRDRWRMLASCCLVSAWRHLISLTPSCLEVVVQAECAGWVCWQ